MATMTTTRQRTASPARWPAALARAMDSGVQVRQIVGSGAWIASSATDPTVAYELAITDGVAHGCSCKAGEFGNPVCCHRAAYYHAAGVLDPEPEPVPRAPALRALRPVCTDCDGQGFFRRESVTFAGVVYRVTCQACGGSGAPVMRPHTWAA